MNRAYREKKTDLVHYVNGEHIVIGEAIIGFDGTYLDITAKITLDNISDLYRITVDNVDHISIALTKPYIKE